jgi:membrane protein
VRFFDAVGRLARRLSAHDAFKAAAAVAFWLFLSLVPLLVLVGFVVGQVARRRGVDVLVEPFLQVVPASAEDIVRVEVGRLAGSGASLAPLGVLGYLWSASSGLHNLLDVFDKAVDARPRPYWAKRAVSLGWVVLGLAATCGVAWLLVRVDGALRSHLPAGAEHLPIGRAVDSGRASRSHGPAWGHSAAHRVVRPELDKLVGAGLTLVAGTAFLGCFYRFTVAHSPGRRTRVWPGTLAAVTCWLVMSWAFGVYAASIANYALFYGSLAAVAVLLVWLYLTSMCLMVGVEINAMLEGRRTR